MMEGELLNTVVEEHDAVEDQQRNHEELPNEHANDL